MESVRVRMEVYKIPQNKFTLLSKNQDRLDGPNEGRTTAISEFAGVVGGAVCRGNTVTLSKKTKQLIVKCNSMKLDHVRWIKLT